MSSDSFSVDIMLLDCVLVFTSHSNKHSVWALKSDSWTNDSYEPILFSQSKRFMENPQALKFNDVLYKMYKNLNWLKRCLDFRLLYFITVGLLCPLFFNTLSSKREMLSVCYFRPLTKQGYNCSTPGELHYPALSALLN